MHSSLHEACHIICMTHECRGRLQLDAGGGYDEENGVCYLQVLLSDHVPGMGRKRMLSDMDSWGYSFRLGSARDWFAADAEDALAWLRSRKLVDRDDCPSWRLRGSDAVSGTPITAGGACT